MTPSLGTSHFDKAYCASSIGTDSDWLEHSAIAAWYNHCVEVSCPRSSPPKASLSEALIHTGLALFTALALYSSLPPLDIVLDHMSFSRHVVVLAQPIIPSVACCYVHAQHSLRAICACNPCSSLSLLYYYPKLPFLVTPNSPLRLLHHRCRARARAYPTLVAFLFRTRDVDLVPYQCP